MSEIKENRVALDDDRLFQKCVAVGVARNTLFRFHTVNSQWEGYVIGLDDFVLRITLASDFRPVEINLDHLVALEELGRPTLSGERKSKLETLTEGIRKASDRLLNHPSH